jgi:predicted 3-demethylubiquinone-9 3-methyltransferase (glyoxalase superfamily)
VLTVEFTVMGIPCFGLNGGPAFTHDEAFSFQVATAGVSWQITPIALTRAVTDPDRAAARRAFDAMMTMTKIDVAAIEAAHRG